MQPFVVLFALTVVALLLVVTRKRDANGQTVIHMTRSEREHIESITQAAQVIGQRPEQQYLREAGLVIITNLECTSEYLSEFLMTLLGFPNVVHLQLEGMRKAWTDNQVHLLCQLLTSGRIISTNLGEIDFEPQQLEVLYDAILHPKCVVGGIYLSDPTGRVQITNSDGESQDVKQAFIQAVRRNRLKPAYVETILCMDKDVAKYIGSHRLWWNIFAGYMGDIVKAIPLEQRQDFWTLWVEQRPHRKGIPIRHWAALKINEFLGWFQPNQICNLSHVPIYIPPPTVQAVEAAHEALQEAPQANPAPMDSGDEPPYSTEVSQDGKVTITIH